MDTNYKHRRFTKTAACCLGLLTLTAWNLTSCRKITGCTTNQTADLYRVQIPVTLYPAKDTFKIGDTLWIEQHFADHLREEVNGLILDFTDFDFKAKAVTADLINYNDLSMKHNQFATVGSIKSTGIAGGVYITYLHENGYYKHKMGIAMTQKGLFRISMRTMRYNDFDFTKCRVEELDLRYSINNKGDNNFHMMQDAKDPFALKANREDFDKFGSYCFYVK